MNKDLEKINKIQKELTLLSQTIGLLEWDQQTYMPSQGHEARAEKMAFLSKILHEKKTSQEFYQLVEKLFNDLKSLDSKEKIMITKLHKDLTKSKKLPTEFVEELTKTTSKAFNAWQKAKADNDFKSFQPHLEKIIKLKRKESRYYAMPGHPYDGLLDDYEEGMTVEILDQKFSELKEKLVKLTKEIDSSQKHKQTKIELLKKDFPKEKQIELSNDVVKTMGLLKEFSRTDFAEHPFSIKVGQNDLRITINVRDDPLFAFGAAMHEAGHSLYEAGLPEKDQFSILGEATSYAIHESQSRFWENMIGLNKPFWDYYFPKFDKAFNLENKKEQWFKELNYVKPNLIRIESDELHYCLHVILRYELEKSLIEGSIEVKDLPKLWNEKMQELFGISPETDSQGVLQDVHWSSGYFGYFPTYALGTIYASQLYQAMLKDLPNIEEDISKGNLSTSLNWLTENVHKYGRSLTAEEIMIKTTGKPLDIETYIDYLSKKYKELY